MSLFKYTVANKEGKKLSGTIEAASEPLARKELNDLGFSVLEIAEQNEPLQQIAEGHQKFEFEAIDIHSKIIKGTIPAESVDKAIIRLKAEYDLTVMAIWDIKATPEEIDKAKGEGKAKLEKILSEMTQPEGVNEASNKLSEQDFVKEKVDVVLKKVLAILKKFDKEFDSDIKTEINKKIDKLLRIKNSKNTEYILITAKELLDFIESQSKKLEEKGYHDQKLELKIETSSLLDELKKTQSPKTLSEDITSKIQRWQQKHNTTGLSKTNFFTKTIAGIFSFIEKFFHIPEEIKILNDQISQFKHQRFDLFKLIFKEPTKEYRSKIFAGIKALNVNIKSTKEKIKEIKSHIKTVKEQNIETLPVGKLSSDTLYEINALTGFILAVYLIYYFISFFFSATYTDSSLIPKGFNLYESNFFKYMISIIFIIHAGSSIKINFFPTKKIASYILASLSVFLILITLLNF